MRDVSLSDRHHDLVPNRTDLAVLAASVVVPAVALGVHPSDQNPGLTGSALVGLAIAGPLVLFRRRHPLPLLAIAIAASVVMLVISNERSPLLFGVVILLYTATTTLDRRTSLIVGAVSTVVIYTALAVAVPGTAIGGEGLATIAWLSLAVALGDATRSRRATLAALEDRAARAERTREEEARRRVAEERLRIARDLHDVVAHQMAVIGTHAAVARQLLRSDPDRADASLATVRTSAASVLHELGDLLDVLRGPDDRAPLEPAPSLAGLPSLVESFTTLGLDVRTTTSGPLDDVDAAVQLTAFRLVQEALTNAQRHGSGTVDLDLGFSEGHLTIEVVNPIAAGTRPGGASGGFGLVGMRERVLAVGGSLRAEATDTGHFVVSARLPHRIEVAS